MSPKPKNGHSLRYVIRCAGCGAEIEIVPAELSDRMAVCPQCKMPNPTPVHALLTGRRPRRPPRSPRAPRKRD